MMKRFTLLTLTLLMGVGLLNAQILLEEPLTDGNVPTGFQNVDNDGNAANAFYTSQGIFSPTDWQGANFGGAFGIALWSTSNFDTATVAPANRIADDWLITRELTFGPSTEVEFEGISSSASASFSVYITNSIAGTTPVPSDFPATPASTVTVPNTGWTPFSFTTGAFDGQDVYVAFVNETNDGDIQGIRNLRIVQPVDNDAAAISIDLAGVPSYETDYLVNDVIWAPNACGGDANQTIELTFFNNGLQPITEYTAFYIVDSLGTGTPVSETVPLGTPIAPGDTFTHVFTNTYDFQTAMDPLYVLDGWVEALGESNNINDSTSIDFVVTPATIDGSTGFFEDFEAVDFGVGSIVNLDRTWAWTFEDVNNDGSSWNLTSALITRDGSGLFGPGNNNSDFALQYLFNATNDADDWAFSPCVDMPAGDYVAEMFVRTAVNFPEELEFGFGPNADAASMTVVENFGAIQDSNFVKLTTCFTIPTSGVVHFGLHATSAADNFFLIVDDLSISPVSGSAPVASFNVAGTDETSPFVEYCDGDVIFTDNSTEVISYSWDFDGDGVEDANTAGPHPFNYSSLGTYNATLAVENCSGVDTLVQTIEVTEIPAPTVTITGLTSDGFDVTLTYVTTPSCATNATYSVDWGNGQITQDTDQDGTITFTYSSTGNYTVTLTALSDEGIGTDEQDILVDAGIETIDLEGELSIYPNPASGSEIRVDFETSSVQDLELSIVSMDGRVLSTRSLENVSDVSEALNISGLSNGVYTFKATSNEGVLTRSFVVSR